MGTCCSRCYSEIQQYRCSNQRIRFNYFADSNPLVEFDSLMEEQEQRRPVSISSWLSCVRGQLSREEEEMELQEESAIDARKEALRIRKLTGNSEIIDPARLAFDNNAVWLGEDPENWNVAGQEYSTLKDNSVRQSANTPESSVDLEWENEDIGLSPPTHAICDDDPVSDTASCLSQLSTPISNGNEELEWDGHFTSTHISHLDLETERLISEIERLTTDVLHDADSGS